MRQDCAPVEIITDHAATRRVVVELVETTQQKLIRGLEMMDEARAVLAECDREMEWHLEARELANQLHEPVVCPVVERYHETRSQR